MSRDFFHTLANEVDALLGAGSAAATTSDRLPQRAVTLRQMARQVPALASLADAITRVCQPREGEAPAELMRSSRALLDLVLLVRQVRIGMGTEPLQGEVVPLPASGPWVNGVPVEELYRMVDSMRSDPGNIDLVEPLAPHDLRLMPLVVLSQEQLGKVSDQIARLDRWGEEGNHAALRHLPRIGRAALPELERDFDFRQRPGAGRRLAAMALIDPESALQFCLRRLPEEPGLLGLLGKVGRPVVEVFVRVLAQPHGNFANWNLDRIASTILTQVPETAVDALRSEIQSSDPARREEAIGLLDSFGRSTAAAVPDLVNALSESLPSIRRAAVRALGQVGRSASTAAAALVACLRDPDSEVQRAAAEALAKLGVPAAKVVPLLIEALDHPEESVRLVVVELLGKSALRNKAAQAALRQAKDRETSVEVRNRIEKALRKG